MEVNKLVTGGMTTEEAVEVPPFCSSCFLICRSSKIRWFTSERGVKKELSGWVDEKRRA